MSTKPVQPPRPADSDWSRSLGATRLRPLRAEDGPAFTAAARASRLLHRPWVSAPTDADAFAAYCSRFTVPHHLGCVVTNGAGELAGAINLTNIIYGAFRSGYLGYFAFLPHAGQGHMQRGLELMLRHAFLALGLNRVEANIQPGNEASRALVQRCGFTCEGFSPRYLKIGGQWRDHERWARLARR